MSPEPQGEFPELRSATVEAWQALAGWWDTTTGEADSFHRALVIPATERLLALRAGEHVLDVGCGNGGYARRLAGLGANVVAVDGSSRLVALAQQKTHAGPGKVEYLQIDASDRDSLLSLGKQSFDAAVAKMVLMDLPVIQPLLSSLAELLRPGGRFVFSVLHPAFNSTGTSLCLEEFTDSSGNLELQRSVKVVRYRRPESHKGVARREQPHPHYYFHRPLAVLFGQCFRAGFVLDGLEEPAFEAGEESSSALSWSAFLEIPPVLVARLRIPG